jgi:hypothetical protein
MIRLPVATSIPPPLRLPTLTIHVAVLVVCALASPGLLPQAACAGGGCNVAPLTNGVAQFVTNDPATFEVSPDQSRWMAVAMRNADGSDWNLEARDKLDPYPTCANGSLAISNQFGPDVLAMDGHYRGPGTDYVIASSGTFAYLEYAQPASATQSNTVWAQIATGPNDFVTVREVQMFSGIPYSIRIQPSAGLGSLKLYVFAPVTTGSGWLAKNQAAVEAALVANSENRIEYTPPADGAYGIVIVNESGATGTFYFAVTHCPFDASLPAENVPFTFQSIDHWPAFTPNAHSWAAVGVRGAPNPYDLDIAPYPRLQDGTYPQCTDSVLASQLTGAGVRVVAGDFQVLPLRQYTAHANLAQPTTSSNGVLEWDGAGDAIAVNAAPIAVAPPANNVLDAWHVQLIKGVTYTIQIVPAGGATADYKLMLFGNPLPAGAHWARRPDAILETSSVHLFIPGYSGIYGVVVVNDNGGTGGYSVSISSSPTGVDPRPAGPLASRIRSAAPNPTVGALQIEFELARAGNAEFRLRSVAGRTVAMVPAGYRDAGTARFAWDASGAVGSRGTSGAGSGGVPPGVYFLSLVVDGVETDHTRITLLR